MIGLAACTTAALAAVAVAGALVFQQAFLLDLPRVPDRDSIWSVGRPAGLTFLDPYGRVIARRGPRHDAWVKLAELPGAVPLAFVAIEDHRFYRHGALDLQGIARAALVNAKAGQTVQGGSTLSQQLARTLFLRPEQTFKRKVQEAVLAVRLEQILTKDEILELYLNRVYFGDRAYGLSAAARTYFGKPAAELSLAEAAMLAALPKAPTKLAPSNDVDAAWARAQHVLRAMQVQGWADETAVRLAAARRPQVVEPEATPEGDLAWVLDAAAQEIPVLAGPKSRDLVVRLTVDPTLQQEGANILKRAILAEGRPLRARQAALVALAPDGAIRAMVGGVDYAKSPFNRAWQARRQPGSAFKPFVWATALERGVHPADLRLDAPVRIGRWTPANFGGARYGMVTVDQALRLSINTVAVRLAQEAGVDRVAALARRFGLSAVPEHPGPSLALGAYEVSLLELTSAYQVLQSGGGQAKPYLISEITDGRGQVVYQRPQTAPAPAYGAFEAAQMVRMMQGVITSGTGTRAGFGRTAAGKTGTSQDYRDAWFVGFTPDWIAGVWVGNDDNRPMAGVTGGKLPATIWRRFMVAAHRGLPSSEFTWAPPMPATSAPRWSPDEPSPPPSEESNDAVAFAYGPDDYRAGPDPVRIRNLDGPSDAPSEQAWQSAEDAPPSPVRPPSPRRAWWPGYPY